MEKTNILKSDVIGVQPLHVEWLAHRFHGLDQRRQRPEILSRVGFQEFP